jgi:WD40 repeat protein
VVGLGIKSLTLSPNNSMIAAGLYDGRIFLYNNLTALEIASLSHLQKIDLNLKYSKTIFIY